MALSQVVTKPKDAYFFMRKIFQLLILSALLGCNTASPAPPTLTPLPPTVSNLQLPTPTIAPTQAEPTLPPPPTVAPAATITITPFVEPTAVPTSTVSLMLREDFGNNRNLLTGELVDDPAVLLERPLAVKISNSPAEFVRPQSGINDADIVFEHTSEGNITRFTAIFYDTLPAQVGPIRSARLVDVELPAMYDAGLVFSGASTGVYSRLNNSDFQERIIYSAEEGYYRTGEDKPYEHTLYGEPAGFRQALEVKGQNTPPMFATHNVFSTVTPENGRPATYAAIDYEWELVEWRYDEENGRYWRWAAGDPIIDALTGEQVSAANVIIISPIHVEDATICEQIVNDQCTHLSIQVQLWGSGTGLLLRDGQQFDVTWHREARNDSLTLTDADGTPVPLQIGNIWVQLVPSWYVEPVVVE